MNLITLAQSAASQSLVGRLLEPQVLVFLIPISAILGGCAVTVTKTIVGHRERITMIQNGYDPDAYGAHK